MLVCITGVSGSGKSTLVHDVLYRGVAYELGMGEGSDPRSLYKELSGTEFLNNIVLVDQAPIGRTPRSNPVTYIKAFDSIRELFAAQPEAQRRGYAAGTLLLQRPRRPLRCLRRRRHRDRRDAVPRRRRAALRRM